MVHKVIKDVDSTRLRNYHKELTKAPHIAGLRRDQELTGWIKEVRYFVLLISINTIFSFYEGRYK